MNFPVFDLHCDTALALLGRDFQGNGSLKKNNHHIDLERAATLPGYAQCFACFTSTWEKLPPKLTVADVFEREMVTVLREVEANSEKEAIEMVRKMYNDEEIVLDDSNYIDTKIYIIK